MSDELVDEVRAALDPTPASEADWPVSRRRVLQGLASVGALSLGPGAASGAAGTGIADQAFFSNYGTEQTATLDGAGEWLVTIDGETFTFGGDDTSTIGLPDGGAGTELVTPSGASASEVIGPDGNVVFDGSVIPDSVILQPESDDLNNFGGDTADYDINSDPPVFDGSLSLKFGVSGTNTDNKLIESSSGLDNYPQVGKTHSFFYNPENDSGSEDAIAWVVFGTDDGESNGYLIDFRGVDELRLRLLDGGSLSTLTSQSGVLQNDWIAVDVTHESDGSITATAFDASDQDASNYREGQELVTLTANDATHITDGSYDHQGVAFHNFRNTQPVVDLWRTD